MGVGAKAIPLDIDKIESVTSDAEFVCCWWKEGCLAGANAIRLGDAKIALCRGTENMSAAPSLSTKAIRTETESSMM
jgi:hypothetical protein